MQKEKKHNNTYKVDKQVNDPGIQRMAYRFNVSIDDVKERYEIIEKQKEMTRAFMENGKALKN